MLGVIPAAFALQTSYAKDDNGNHHGQIKNGNNGNHYGQMNHDSLETNDASSGKLEGQKLTICQREESILKTTMQRAIDQGERQLSVFKSIADRTKAFYQDQGRVSAEYAAANAAADTKYNSAKEIIDNLSTQTFACSDDNAKHILVTFRNAVTAKNQALHEYRTAVKDLIVTVKSAQKSREHQAEAR